jgi:hypothetical protein
LPYPGDGGGYYPVNAPGRTVIVLEECPFDLSSRAVLPNPPTSWFWNVRIGDQVRINNVGPIFTVVGPLNQTGTQGNSELFVNVGPPGTQSPLARLFLNGDQAIVYYPDFLFLVNGQDDNHNGWIDDGWDGVDNNGDGQVDELAEWELEDVPQSIAGPLQNIRLVTVFARTGLITTNENPPFDTPSTGPTGSSHYNPNRPFIAAQQGVSGGH